MRTRATPADADRAEHPEADPATRRRHIAICVRGGIALLAVGGFVVVTHKLYERKVDAVDRALLRALARRRRGWLTGAAVDVSRLGSPIVLTGLTAAAVVTLMARRRRADALQVLIASAGAGTVDQVVKHVVERRRPVIVPRLAAVTGFSYPSGHALAGSAIYLTLSLVASRQLPAVRPLVHATGALLVGAIALSRVYLGVHYPSDVASGVCLGAGWALIVDAVSVARAGRRARTPRRR